MSFHDEEAERAYRAMLLETMRPCRELPRHERQLKRDADRRMQRHVEEQAATDQPEEWAV